MSSKTISIRLSSELIHKIDERCVTDEVCRNDFVKNAIEEALLVQNESLKPTISVSCDDGKTWTEEL